MKFVDAHVHLTDPEYKGMVDKLIEESAKSNVVALVSNPVDLETSKQSLRLTKKYKGLVYTALGIHPWNVKELKPDELESTVKFIEDHSKDKGVIAVGEIGLDTRYLEKAENKAELQELQHKVFHEMLRAAEETSLPVITHSRGATRQIVEMLPSYNVKRVILHWFSQPLELLQKIVDQGYLITEGPPVAYSKGAQEIIKQTPITNLLTETDGPVRYMGSPFKGKTTMPTFIPTVVEKIAELKNMKKAEVAHQICQNFTDFFSLTPSRYHKQ